MKIRIQGNKIIKYTKAKNGRTYQETFDLSKYGVSNLMRRLSTVGILVVGDKKN